jgi:hypothetical protein
LGLAALLLAEFDRRSLRAQSFLLSALVTTRCLVIDLLAPQPVLAIAPTVVCLWAAMLRRELGSLPRLYNSLLATTLLGALIYHEVAGGMLTVAWGVEAVVLLAAGFALRSRASPLRPRPFSDLHVEALLLGPSQSGNAAAHRQLHRPGTASGNRQLGLHPLPRSGPALSVTPTLEKPDFANLQLISHLQTARQSGGLAPGTPCAILYVESSRLYRVEFIKPDTFVRSGDTETFCSQQIAIWKPDTFVRFFTFSRPAGNGQYDRW